LCLGEVKSFCSVAALHKKLFGEHKPKITKKMYINIIKTYRNVVAICDSDLLGKRFEEDIFQLDVKESFFKGEEKSEEEIIEICKDMRREDATFNIIGNDACNAALKAGIIKEEAIGKIADIPYTLILM